MKALFVGSPQAGQRLDSTLNELLPKYSRSAWQKLIKDGRVKVNGRIIVRASTAVNNGDELTVEFPLKPAKLPKVPIIYQDESVAVFDKPAGLLTHAKDNLASEWTLADVAKPLIEGDSSNRAGIVHRLDRATSGVIIVARNPQAKAYLQKQFAARKVEKVYWAVVKGQLSDKTAELDLPIGRNPRRPATYRVDSAGKVASTVVKVKAANDKASLLELRPLTGRTHQLRVQLAHIGHPIIGDVLYGVNDNNKYPRLYLHAKRLALTLPNGQQQSFTADLPQDFKTGIKQYGLD